MNNLEEFSRQTASTKHSKAIFSVIKDMFSLGVKEFSKSISHVFETPEGGKHQVSNEFSKREQSIIKQRRPYS